METVKCDFCGKTINKEEAVYCEDYDCYACPDCAEEHLTRCERCGTLIPIDDAYRGFDGYLCECCHDDLFG